MSHYQNFSLIRMGVVNITPNSFSDGGELKNTDDILAKIKSFGEIEVLDFGAESTAPMNSSIGAEEEWQRLQVILPLIKNLKSKISIDTYRAETISKILKFWKDNQLSQTLIWNDVSGKFDDHVKDFISHKNVEYVFCHNLAPERGLSGQHMQFVSQSSDEIFLQELSEFFSVAQRPNIIFDPCLGFSKSYDQNWYILENFEKLQKLIHHSRWMLGLSRKSFLRKKYGVSDNKSLDELHLEELNRLRPQLFNEIWLRTHRPELLK
ncbi:MAG: dihydropteroate synthase [Bacteriovoracaceae bacterium]